MIPKIFCSMFCSVQRSEQPRCCLEIVKPTNKSNQQRSSSSKFKVYGLTPLARSFMIKHLFHNLQCHHFLQNIFKRWPNFCFAMLKFFNDRSKRATDFDSKMEGQSSSSCQVHTSVPTHLTLLHQIIWRTSFHFFISTKNLLFFIWNRGISATYTRGNTLHNWHL